MQRSLQHGNPGWSRWLLSAVNALAMLLVLTGCGNESSQPPTRLEINMSTAGPSQYPDTGTLLAWVVIDGGARIPLSVDTVNETVSGVISGVPPGQHTIEIIIEFEFNDTALGILELARTTLTVDVTGATTTVNFDQNSYVHANDDNDAYSNAQEIIGGSDPFDGASVPPPGSVPTGGVWNTMQWNRSNWR